MGSDQPDFIIDAKYEFDTNCVGFACYILLVWDQIITFGDEVRYVWKGRKRKTFLIYLFLLNRYLIPLGFILNLHAYLSPVWTPERCARFVRTEGSLTFIGVAISNLMMMIRVTAIYAGNKIIFGILATMFCFQVGVNAWLLTAGIPVPHHDGVRGCTMIFAPSIPEVWASASAWMPLLYDTFVLLLTFNKTIAVSRISRKIQTQTTTSFIAVTLLKDGILYYSMIFAVNLVLIIMIIAAPPGLKLIAAQSELLITVAMMSRITLSLRKHLTLDHDEWLESTYPHPNHMSAIAHWTFAVGADDHQEIGSIDINEDEDLGVDATGTRRDVLSMIELPELKSDGESIQ